MAKMNKTISFKNCEFHVSKDELTGERRIMILEQLKDDDIDRKSTRLNSSH